MYKHFFKRLIDIAISLVGIVCLIPIFIIVAPIIYLADRGPVFYNAQRIGKNGKLFKMYKFRSMYVDAPDIRLSDGSTYNGDDDPRVTKIGRFMRKTSIDEFPQFINVFLGHMSVIGPRPDTPDCINNYSGDMSVILTVKPGITGYNQAYYRNDADGKTKMANDAHYVTNCTFWMDIKIIFKTIAVVLKHENIYTDTSKETEAKEAIEKFSVQLSDSVK